MGRVRREQRYNARGERLCSACRRYLPVDRFARHKGCFDGMHPRCRECAQAQLRQWEHRRYADDGAWRSRVTQMNAWKRRQRAERHAERAAFVVAAVNRLRERGFALAELQELTGVRAATLGQYSAGRCPSFFRPPQLRGIERALLATDDLPLVGRPRGGGAWKRPHPALPLVRARLARMELLAALAAEAA